MTRLRFAGDLPLWLGLVLAFLAAAMAWRYYRRESFELSPRLRWLLPALRATAFFLGILILTGPVLHHRETIGELGRVKVYVDGSQSMGLFDRHLPASRKLLIAEQQGWLPEGIIDAGIVDQIEDLAQVIAKTEAALQSQPTVQIMTELKGDLVAAIQSVPATSASSVVESDSRESILTRLHAISLTGEQPTEAELAALTSECKSIRSLQLALASQFETDVQRLIDSGDKSAAAALTLFDETPRWQRAERSLLDSSTALFDTLKTNHNVEVMVLQNNQAIELLDGVATETLPEQLSHQPTASSTDLTSGISATQKSTEHSEASQNADSETSGKPNTAVVLLTDGQHNSGPSPLQTARVLGGQGISFYPVSFGATNRAPDLAVTDVEHPQMVFRKDNVRGSIVFRDRLSSGQSTMAKVRHEDTVLWQQEVITNGQGERRIEFEFDIEELVNKLDGQFDDEVVRHAITMNMQASITPLAEEVESTNNERPLRFAAVTQSYRLLIIDGRSRWETRYLRNAFERDSQWEVNAVIAGPGTDDETIPRGDADGTFPESRDALFRYDIIVFGEVVPELLADYEYQWIREFVESRGGGLIFVDGNRKRLKNFNADNLGPLLPVEWLPTELAVAPIQLQLTDKAARMPAFAFELDSASNQDFWKQLPPPQSLNHVAALPGAEVLVQAVVADSTSPAVVTQSYGAGRILYLASDETWRWRYKAADTYHQRIWNQWATYVMPRPFAVSDEFVDIDSGPVNYNSGDSAGLRIQLRGLDGKPASDSTVDAIVWKQGQIVSTVSLDLDDDLPGLYRGNTGALSEGAYEVSVRASGFSQEALKARSQFTVAAADSGELNATACNESLLKQMATESGGTYLREEQLGQLSKLLSPLSNGRVVESDTVLWQSYWWFSAILLLLTVEWFLRKRAGLL